MQAPECSVADDTIWFGLTTCLARADCDWLEPRRYSGRISGARNRRPPRARNSCYVVCVLLILIDVTTSGVLCEMVALERGARLITISLFNICLQFDVMRFLVLFNVQCSVSVYVHSAPYIALHLRKTVAVFSRHLLKVSIILSATALSTDVYAKHRELSQ